MNIGPPLLAEVLIESHSRISRFPKSWIGTRRTERTSLARFLCPVEIDLDAEGIAPDEETAQGEPDAQAERHAILSHLEAFRARPADLIKQWLKTVTAEIAWRIRRGRLAKKLGGRTAAVPS
jgi:hypothetical protein